MTTISETCSFITGHRDFETLSPKYESQKLENFQNKIGSTGCISFECARHMKPFGAEFLFSLSSRAEIGLAHCTAAVIRTAIRRLKQISPSPQ